MAKDTTNIQKIVFNIHGKKLELTNEEAKELKGILCDLFGEVKYVDRWNYWPNYPHWTYTAGQSGTFTGATAITNATSGTVYLNALSETNYGN